MPNRALYDFSTMRENARPRRSFVSEVDIYWNNQNLITIVAVRPNINDNFLSRE
jgi:hypothetical protein